MKFSTPVTVNFKNPFSEEKAFDFRVEPSDFKIKQKSENIGSKKIFKAQVSLLTQRNKSEVKYPITGKLIISCKDPSISWVYYLKESVE